MPQGEVYLDLDQLKNEVIIQTENKLKEIDAAMEQACNTIAVLTICGWSGEAKDAFLEKFSTYKMDMRLFYNKLADLKTTLNGIYEEGTTIVEQGKSLGGTL